MSALRNFSDDELVRHAQVEFDPITGTELEAELLRRFEDYSAEGAPLLAVLADLGYEDADGLRDALKATGDWEANDLKALLGALNDADYEDLDDLKEAIAMRDLALEFDLDDPEILRKVLERDKALSDLSNDLAAPLASLQKLITQEA
jgi:hypothetical protein